MGESSEVALGRPASDATTPALTTFVFLNPEGDVTFDFRKVKAVETVVGKDRFILASTTLRIFDDTSGKMAVVAFGEATYLPAGRPPEKLAPGKPAKLSPTAP
jgi:hypothetical protein